MRVVVSCMCRGPCSPVRSRRLGRSAGPGSRRRCDSLSCSRSSPDQPTHQPSTELPPVHTYEAQAGVEMLPPAAAACDLAEEVNTVGPAEQLGPVLLLLLLKQPGDRALQSAVLALGFCWLWTFLRSFIFKFIRYIFIF